eukprot:scaffold535_cov260-Pinguiococcus_pyrenoidosus.AAC.16
MLVHENDDAPAIYLRNHLQYGWYCHGDLRRGLNHLQGHIKELAQRMPEHLGQDPRGVHECDLVEAARSRPLAVPRVAGVFLRAPRLALHRRPGKQAGQRPRAGHQHGVNANHDDDQEQRMQLVPDIPDLHGQAQVSAILGNLAEGRVRAKGVALRQAVAGMPPISLVCVRRRRSRRHPAGHLPKIGLHLDGDGAVSGEAGAVEEGQDDLAPEEELGNRFSNAVVKGDRIVKATAALVLQVAGALEGGEKLPKRHWSLG